MSARLAAPGDIGRAGSSVGPTAGVQSHSQGPISGVPSHDATAGIPSHDAIAGIPSHDAIPSQGPIAGASKVATASKGAANAELHMLYEDAYNLEVVFRQGAGTVAFPLQVVAGKSKLCWQNLDGEYEESSVPASLATRVLKRPAAAQPSRRRVVGKQQAQDCNQKGAEYLKCNLPITETSTLAFVWKWSALHARSHMVEFLK